MNLESAINVYTFNYKPFHAYYFIAEFILLNYENERPIFNT